MIQSGYYSCNSFYRYIKENKKDNFKYFSRNLWLLVYGNTKQEPKLIIVLSSLNSKFFKGKELSSEEEYALKLAYILSEQSGVPYVYFGFNEDETSLKAVKVLNSKVNEFSYLNLEEFRELLIKYELPITDSPSLKKINKSYSNAYQKWQLLQGNGLVASDIDLLQIRNGKILNAFELKRSKISLNRWEPYREDYHNFELLSSLFTKAKIKFYIVYNHRREIPFFDDTSKLKLFNFNINNNPKVTFLRYASIEEFFKIYEGEQNE